MTPGVFELAVIIELLAAVLNSSTYCYCPVYSSYSLNIALCLQGGILEGFYAFWVSEGLNALDEVRIWLETVYSVSESSWH